MGYPSFLGILIRFPKDSDRMFSKFLKDSVWFLMGYPTYSKNNEVVSYYFQALLMGDCAHSDMISYSLFDGISYKLYKDPWDANRILNLLILICIPIDSDRIPMCSDTTNIGIFIAFPAASDWLTC